MKFSVLALIALFTFSLSAQAESLVGCKLYADGVRVEEIKAFTINNYSSDEPEAEIDGGLLDFTRNRKTVKMSFSNECDNIYEITFSIAAIAKAKSGEYKTLIGKASIGTADMEKPISGILRCTVRN